MGHSSGQFQYVKDWEEKKIRQHLMRAPKRGGSGWGKWSRVLLYEHPWLYADYGGAALPWNPKRCWRCGLVEVVRLVTLNKKMGRFQDFLWNVTSSKIIPHY